MNDEKLNNRLQKLIEEIASLPKDQQKQLVPLIEETEQHHKDIKKNMDKITRFLEDIRVYIKYLVFDIEATRRERDELKKILDDLPPDDNKPNKTSGKM